MSEVIVCPLCQRRIRMPAQMLGKRIKCPGCGGGFVAGGEPQSLPPAITPDPPLVEPEPDLPMVLPEPEPVEPAPATQQPSEAMPWNGVRTGLAVQGLAHILYVLGLAALILVSLVATVNKNDSPSKAGLTFQVLLVGFASFMFLSNLVMSLVAQSCCMLGPHQTATRVWSVAGLALAALLVLQGLQTWQLPGLGLEHPSAEPGLTVFLNVIPLGLFLEAGRLTVLGLFLRGLGGETNNRFLATFGTYLGLGTLALFVLNFLMTCFWYLIGFATRSDIAPDFGRGRDVDWIGWLIAVFNLLSIIVILLVGVFAMFRAWQALGPQPAVVSRRSLT
jgi:hypothetical protein